MLATGGSALMAIRCLMEAGVKESALVFVTVVVCPEVCVCACVAQAGLVGAALERGGDGYLCMYLEGICAKHKDQTSRSAGAC